MLIFVLGFTCYANTLNGPFLFDDWQNISYNGYIRIHNLSPTALADVVFRSPIPSRPIANISFALNYLVHGYWLPGYHLINITIHCLTGVLLFYFIRGTFATPALRQFFPSEKVIQIAGFSSLLWLLNPLDSQSVSYIVQRMNSLSSMFILLSMVLYLKARTAEKYRPAYFAGCLSSVLLAIGTKEIAATLPLCIFFYDWYFLQDLNYGWLKRKLPLLCLAALAIMVVAWFYLGRDFSSVFNGYQARDFTVWQRLLTEPRVVCRYLALIFFPYPGLLNLDHDYAISTGLLQPPTTVPAIIALAVIFLLAIVSAPRYRLLSFSILWFFLNLIIESSIIPLEIIFDHRTYLPSMLIWPPLLSIAWQLPEQKRKIALAGAVVVIVIFAGWTYQRNQVWADEMAINRDIVSKSPGKGRTHANLGRALIRAGQEDEGLRELNQALKLSPNQPVIYLNFGYYYLERLRYQEAIANFRKVIELSPGNITVYCYLGKAYLGNKQYPEAVAASQVAINNPAFKEEALLTLGIASSEIGDLKSAINSFSELSHNYPNNGRYRFNLGRALEKIGQKQQALQNYKEALELVSDNDKEVIRQAISRIAE